MGTTERILQYIDYKGISKYRFCKNLGFSNKFLDNSSNMGTDKACKILHYYPEINPEWLLTGFGDMLKNQSNNNSSSETPTAYRIKDKEIPLVNIKAIAEMGNNNFSIEEKDIKDFYLIPKFKHNKIDFMIEVEGASMYPNYNSGDIVACRIINGQGFIQWNKTHVIATKGQGIIIKRLKKNDDNTLTMISDNESFDPFTVSYDEINGIALVVGVIKLE